MSYFQKMEIGDMTIYIINKSSHDYAKAKEFGDLVYLSEGPINRFDTNHIHRIFWEKLQYSNGEDYLLICGLTIMNCVACGIMGSLHSRLNLLLYKDGKYIPRNLILKEGE